jgi:hypothetical protein
MLPKKPLSSYFFLLILSILTVFALARVTSFRHISLPIIEPSENVVSTSWNCPVELSRTIYPYHYANLCTSDFLAYKYEDKLKFREHLYFTYQLHSTRSSIPLSLCENKLLYKFRQARLSNMRSDVIVYLTQKRNHLVYKREVFHNTNDSLKMLFDHYRAANEADILLEGEGEGEGDCSIEIKKS